MDNNELLFWRIFRNKWLRNLIFSYNDYKFNKLIYSQIVSVDWLLENEYIQVLKNKVKLKEYLIFGYSNVHKCNNNYNGYNNEQYLELEEEQSYIKKVKRKIYNKIRYDTEFYENLFRNYPIYYSVGLLSTTSTENNKKLKKQLINTMIENHCLGGLIVLLKQYNFQIKEKHLIESIRFQSLEIANYIFSYYNSNFKSFNDVNLNSKGLIKSNKIWKLIINQDELLLSSPCYSNRSFNEKILFLIKVLKLKIPNEIKGIEIYTINESLWEFYTLLDLINTCEVLIYLSEKPLKSFIKNITQFNEKTIKQSLTTINYSTQLLELFLKEPLIILSIDKLNQIKSNFNQQQLSTKLNELLELPNSSIKELFQMILPFIGITNYFENYIFYLLKFTDKLNIYTIDRNLVEIKLIFKYLKQDREKTKLFLQSFISKCDSSEKCNIIISNLFIQFIENDDIEFLKLTRPLLSTHYYPNRTLDKVTSIKVFKFLYTTMNNVVLNDLNSIKSLLINNRNPKVIEYFKQLYPKEYNDQFNKQFIEFQLDSYLLLSNSTSSKSIFKNHGTSIDTIILFIYNNLNQFKLKYPKLLNNIIPIWINEPDRLISFKEFEIFYKISKNFDNFNIHPQHPLFIKNTNQERLLLFSYYTSSIKPNAVNNIETVLKENNQDQDEFNKFYENCNLLLTIIGKNGDLTTLSIILSNFYPNFKNQEINNFENYINHHKKKSFDSLFLWASQYGQISIFKYVLNNYSFLLLNINTNNTLNHCLHLAKKNQHLELIDFIIKINKRQIFGI